MGQRAAGRVATPEKAIFDLAYVSAARGAPPRRVPEIDLPAGFDRAAIDEWIAKIGDPRVATMTKEGCAADPGEGRSVGGFAAGPWSRILGRLPVAIAGSNRAEYRRIIGRGIGRFPSESGRPRTPANPLIQI